MIASARRAITICAVAAVLTTALTGCDKPKEQQKVDLNKKTQDIGELQDGDQVVDPTVKVTNPITAGLEAYEPLKQQVTIIAVTHALDLFNATEGRYPKDHDEFMNQVIKANNIQLPAPGKGFEYKYNVDDHALVIVKTEQ